MALDVAAFVPDEGAEAARVAQAKNACPEREVEMVVFAGWSFSGDQAQAARHAEMQHQPATPLLACTVEEQVFPATVDGFHAQSDQPLGQPRSDCMAQAGRAHDGGGDLLADDEREQSLAADFNLWKFRHCRWRKKPITCGKRIIPQTRTDHAPVCSEQGNHEV